MDRPHTTPQAPAAGELLLATAAQLRARRDELEPLVDGYDRVQRIVDAFRHVPAAGDGADEAPAENGSPREARGDDRASSRPEYAELVSDLQAAQSRLETWLQRLEPLVREFEQILHVLQAFESAETLPPHVAAGHRRPRRHVSRGRSLRAHDRTDQLRGLLTQPRARAEIAELMGLSRARVTELIEPLARTGEVIEVPDPDRRSRKLWVLAQPGEHGAAAAEQKAAARDAAA